MIPRRFTLAGLLVLIVWLLLAPPAGQATEPGTRLAIGVLCAAPLLILLLTGLLTGLGAVRRWGVWVAIVMIPYFTLSVGALLVSPGGRLEGAVLSTLIALLFFSGIAASRQPR